MHKKGITEEVAKKRSRKTVKHQRGIVGADLAFITARRNQTAVVRSQQRLAAITKAKSEKKDKETKKAKVRVVIPFTLDLATYCIIACTRIRALRPQGIEAANEGWQGWKMIVTTLIFTFEHCNRASDTVQLHPFVVFITTLIRSHSHTYGMIYSTRIVVS